MGESLLAKTIREQARSHSGSRFAVATGPPALFTQHPACEQDTVIENAPGKKLPLTVHNPGLGLMRRSSKQCWQGQFFWGGL